MAVRLMRTAYSFLNKLGTIIGMEEIEQSSPTIRGIFVNSHIEVVRQKKGEEGVRELEKRYGKPLNFKNSDNVPVREEIKVIEAALDVLGEKPIPPEERAFEAGRLHFRDFTGTPLGKIIFSIFKNDFKIMMTKSRHIAEHVFLGVKLIPEDLGPNAVKVIMENGDYPIDHFRGLFQEWMDFSGEVGTVEAREIGPRRYEYTMRWK